MTPKVLTKTAPKPEVINNQKSHDGVKVEMPEGESLDMANFAQMVVNASLLNFPSRAEFGQLLGQQFGGDRDIYKAAGYPVVVEAGKYDGMYRRNDIAKRIINAFPDSTWRGSPQVIENEEDVETEFEIAFKLMVKERKLWYYLKKADRFAGIGNYSLILLGFDDGKKLHEEVALGSADKLLFMQVYKQTSCSIKIFEDDSQSERFGQPKMYEIEIKNFNTFSESSDTNQTKLVHWSRIIHVAEDTQENDWEGTPRLEIVLNRLYDLEKIMAGGAENFWRSGFPGLNLNMSELAKELTDSQKTDLDTEIKQYMHGLSRVLRTRGIEASELAQTVNNPEAHVDSELKLISGATGIPIRILVGSERGELASTQDRENWKERIDERRETFAEPFALRPFIDRNIDAGTLPAVDEYSIKWPEMDQLSRHDEAAIAATITAALASYVSNGADQVIPLFHFLTMILGFDQKETEELVKQIEAEQIEEDKLEEEVSERDFQRQKELKGTGPAKQIGQPFPVP